MKRIVVIGGGAAGLVCAITAARTNPSVKITILEGTDRVGKKLLTTGNGRCNLTNVNLDVSRYHGDTEPLADLFSAFGSQEAMDFFESIGVIARIEEDGKVYPYSLQASSVVDVLRFEAERLGIVTKCEYYVTEIEKRANEFYIHTKNQATEIADCVVLATGGKTAPHTGSDGSGYHLVKSMGHRVSELFPSLVQMKSEDKIVRSLKGIKLDALVTLYSGGTERQEYGEVLFTDYGISGPPVLQLSGWVHRDPNALIWFDIVPELDAGEIYEMLKERRDRAPEQSLEHFFTGFLNKRVGQAQMKACGFLPLSRRADSLSDQDLERLSSHMKRWEIPISGTLGWNQAQVTKGGVPLSEISTATMESKKTHGLYLIGELLNVDGDCGGFNLQWAWTSAVLAGQAVGETE